MRGSSRSISAPAPSSGPSKPSAGRTASASRARRCTTTAWSSPVSRAARWRAAARSRRSAPKTASRSGRSTPFRGPASSVTTRGRRTATRGSSAARPCGRRRPSIPSSASSISRRVIPAPICTAACGPATTCSASRSSRSTRAPASYRWHFQQVHHDIWDYDSPNPVVLFDAPVNGVMRKGLVQVSKTGWAYILDRATGEPLIGIEERAVPQEPRQATAATQPYPVGDAIVPQSIDIPPEGASVLPDGAALINDGKIFTPFWTEPIALKPGTMGGANWPPSSYDPETHLLYVCASDRINSFVVQEKLPEPAANHGVHGRPLHAGRRRRSRHSCGARRHDQQARVAAGVARDLLQRLGRHGRRLVVRRPQRRPAHGARQSQRQAAVGVHDRRRRQYDGDDVRVERRSARRRARGRRRVRGRDARRRHLDVLADGHDEVVACDDGGAGGGGGPARPGRPPARGRESAGRRRARPAALRRGVRRVSRRRRRRRPRRRPDARRGPAARDDPCGFARRPQHDAGVRPRVQRGRSARTSRATSSTFSRSNRRRPSLALVLPGFTLAGGDSRL